MPDLVQVQNLVKSHSKNNVHAFLLLEPIEYLSQSGSRFFAAITVLFYLTNDLKAMNSSVICFFKSVQGHSKLPLKCNCIIK